MVNVPAFRNMLLAALDERSRVGTAESGDNGVVTVKTDQGFSISRTTPGTDDDSFARGIAVPIRICDFYAWQLATLEGAPAFNPCWHDKRREAGLAAMAAFLRRKAAR